MRLHGLILIASCLLIGATGADDNPARALIDEAIVAHGGEAALARWGTVTTRTEGIFHGYERTPVFFFTYEATAHGADQLRQVLDGRIELPDGKPEPQKFQIANVLDGRRGWIKMASEEKDETRECTPEEPYERQEAAYVGWISKLPPLKDQSFALTLAGEALVDRRPAVGVRVSSPGHRDVTLFFDQETKLLVKTETRSKGGLGVEGKVETFLRQHKAFHGVQQPTTMMMSHDGRPIISHWVLDYRLAQKPETGAFAKP